LSERIRARHSARSLLPSLVVAAIVIVLDQLTKHWAINRLSDGRDIDVIGSLRFNLAFNSGMAFSRGEGLGPIIGVVAVVVVAVLLVGLRREGSRLGDIASGMVIGGALGNVVDRLFRGDGWFHGSVIDFIDLQWWPIFNVADMAITIGGVLLVLGTVFAGSPTTDPAGADPADARSSSSESSSATPSDPMP
jgi:signal peptidase II